MEKIEKMESGCWNFTGGKDSGGYGKIYTHSVGRATKLKSAHRAMYEICCGPIPEGRFVCHHCDNRVCVNPDHLFIADQKGNMDDMTQKSRRSMGHKHSELIKRGWTQKVRDTHSAWGKRREHQKHLEQTRQAGVPESWKFCPNCNQWLPKDGFHKNKARYDGVHNHCKKCRSQAH